MENRSFRKSLAIAVVILFFGVSAIPSVIGDNPSFVNTIYVDDDNIEGPWDGTQDHPYQHIQDAIDNAIDGDTVYVYGGTYFENVIVDKSVELIGEDNSTIVDGDFKESVLNITADNVKINGFILKNTAQNKMYAGIEIHSDCNIISSNKIINTNRGIISHNSNENEISNNFITDVVAGIHLDDFSCNNIVSDNLINESIYTGIEIQHYSINNTITRNIISNGDLFLTLRNSNNNNIFLNSITKNIGRSIMFIVSSKNNNISNNNLIDNEGMRVHVYNNQNIFNGNYWGRSRLSPKFIISWKMIEFPIWIPFINIDWHPAKEPYDIP
jgi:parallel beta-helix repeat protein